MTNKRLLVLSAPSGGGKTTVAKHVLSKFSNFGFSVSATTRAPRAGETNGKDYYFFSKEEFINKIKNNEFAEHEEIFNNIYGTLKSEIDNALNGGKNLIFDIDVKGALSIKKAYPGEAFLLFLMPPDLEELENRLRNRDSENEVQIETRLARSAMEIAMKNEFDAIIINDDLHETLAKVEQIIQEKFVGVPGI